MATAIIAAIALLAGPTDVPTQEGGAIMSNVLVTASGDPKNLFEAGISAPYVALEATNFEGQASVLYLLRMVPADPFPPLGGMCTFETVQEPLLPGRLVDTFRDTPTPEDGEPVTVIGHFDCRITSDSPVID
jgi:hypothetical protein